MKNETITLRVDSNLKDNFKKLCELEGVDMSKKMEQYIIDETTNKEIKSLRKDLVKLFINSIIHKYLFISDFEELKKELNNEFKKCFSFEITIMERNKTDSAGGIGLAFKIEDGREMVLDISFLISNEIF